MQYAICNLLSLSRHYHHHLGALAGARAQIQATADLGGALAHADKPKVPAVRRLQHRHIEARAVVGHAQGGAIALKVEPDHNIARAGVLDDIVKRLLYDPVDRLLSATGVALLAADLQL